MTLCGGDSVLEGFVGIARFSSDSIDGVNKPQQVSILLVEDRLEPLSLVIVGSVLNQAGIVPRSFLDGR